MAGRVGDVAFAGGVKPQGSRAYAVWFNTFYPPARHFDAVSAT
jgi:hypothetical protein